MKIGILSDSHTKSDYTELAINHLKQKGANYLIHAGDLCIEDNLKLLQNSKLVYVTVFGNNDRSLLSLSNEYNIQKEPYYFKIKDIKFKLMHLPYYLNADSDIVIFGHTHKFECSYNNGTLFINPGEICAREKPLIECALLEINKNEYIITYYYKDINTNNFMKEEFRYER
ncbi:YfcE family phosphodiesterase [Malaciobacter marinus]|uniref:Phosphoesterase n=1 Tax=Malaciobacter marinus TaxID=505249 RepID=A0A347TP49_9BACT|nr:MULTISPECIES: YfcE family phosphodiesterase [Malaciobacter]AXX88377.1 YfcE family phosphodiesterase [Malaciobacter marinus]PHO13411.1 YfcE family phosphodiesterase [Malaciobacter marinus]PHO16643.1 YfcE family phosphodiesterase [Malaciobacter marinus]RYA24630.1 YfcE family phosphodiesterase [Malaciobacter halophilus]